MNAHVPPLTHEQHVDLIHRRETEAQKIARARGRVKSWTGFYYVADEDREMADAIVKSGQTLCRFYAREGDHAC